MKPILSAALLLFSTLTHAAFPVEIFEYLDNVKLVAFIQQQDIDNSQSWSPEQGEPPLGIKQVIEATMKNCQDDKNIINPAIKRIELRPVPQNPDHWHYTVMVGAGAAGEKQQNHYYVVLMSGKVITAIREPEGYK